MRLTMLGTGNALATGYYNTCFVLNEGDQYLLVDGGGGNGLFTQLNRAGIDWRHLRHIFVTHKHIDHLLGVLWMVRVICQYMSQDRYEGEAKIYAHQELTGIIENLARTLLQENETRALGKRLHLVPVADGEELDIIGRRVAFFDINSTKARQFGFSMHLDNDEKLTCCGDEPYNEREERYVAGSKWLMHEAYCLYAQADRFKPYEKHHATVKEACELAERLRVKNLILYHTEDKSLPRRKELYMEEGKRYYRGNLHVPDDLETFEL